MATYPAELRYTREHEWAQVEGKRARVGITHYAQDQLGDVVFVELPKVGARVTQMQTFGVVESVKAVSDLFAPLSGDGRRGEPGSRARARAREPGPLRRGLAHRGRAGEPRRGREADERPQYEEFLKTAGGH